MLIELKGNSTKEEESSSGMKMLKVVYRMFEKGYNHKSELKTQTKMVTRNKEVILRDNLNENLLDLVTRRR